MLIIVHLNKLISLIEITMKKHITYLLLLFILISTSSFLPNNKLSLKKDPIITKVLVVGTFGTKPDRTMMEKEIVLQLGQLGYAAVMSQNTSLQKAEKINKENVLKAVEECGCDGVFVVQLEDFKDKVNYTSTVNMAPRYTGFYFADITYSYYNRNWDSIKTTDLRVYSNLYELVNKELVFSFPYNGKNFKDAEDFVGTFGPKAAKKLAKSGFLKSRS